MKSKFFPELEIQEPTLGDMLDAQSSGSNNTDLSMQIAAKCVFKDGVAIGIEGIRALPLKSGLKLIEEVADFNKPAEGNA